VLAALDFHDQPGLVAHKIGNVAADRRLAVASAVFARPALPPSVMFRRKVRARPCVVNGMLPRLSACATRSITPSQPSPIKAHQGAGSKECNLYHQLDATKTFQWSPKTEIIAIEL
jgi:hypothetical protein